MPLLTTLSLRTGEQPGAVGSWQESPDTPPRFGLNHMPAAFVGLLAVNCFVVSGAACFALLYLYR